MRAQLLVASTLASGLVLLGVACGTETVYVYEDAGAAPGTSSGSTSGGKSSSGGGKSSSGSKGDDDDDTKGDDDDTKGDDDDTKGDDDDDDKGDAGTDGGSSSGGYTVVPSTKLVGGNDVVLLGLVGDDAIYRQLKPTGTPSPVFAVPIAGGAPTKLWELGGTDNQAIVGAVIGHWSNIANSVGTLEVWTRASGLKSNIATNSAVGVLRASADGSRIAFSQDTVLAGNKPVSTALGVRGINDTTNIVTLDGAEGLMNLASANCPVQLAFAGQTLFAEFCLGTTATQNLARLVALPGSATSFVRIDAPDLAAANTLAGQVRFSTDAAGTKVVAASLGGSENTGRVYTVATPSTGIVDLEPFPTGVGGTLYTMTPDGTQVFYRVPATSAPNEVKAAVVTSSPATVKVVSAGVRSLSALSPDGHAMLFSKLAPASGLADINLVDFSVATPAPRALVATAKGAPIGFTGTSSHAVFVEVGTAVKLRSAPVASGDPIDLVTANTLAGGRPVQTSTSFIFYTDLKSPANFPKCGDINFVDAANPQAPKKISSGVPLGQGETELYVTGKKVVYTRLTLPNGPQEEDGIYTITLP